MLKLYGFAVSNYFNMVKHVLLEKGVDYEEVTVFPEQGADYRAKSPMGKVPCLETAEGFLCETSVILDYLEASYPDKPLLPASAWEQAKVRELMKIAELYIELPARRLLPAMLMGTSVDDSVKTEVREQIGKGLRAVNALSAFQPFVLGEQQTLADIVLRYSLYVAKPATASVAGWDLLEDQRALRDWDARMAENPICRQLDADTQAQMEAFIKKVSGK